MLPTRPICSPRGDVLPRLHVYLGKMGIACLVTETVVDKYLPAVSPIAETDVGGLHDTVARRVDRVAYFCGKVDAVVFDVSFIDGVHPASVGTDAVAQVSFVDGPYGRDGGGHVFFVRGKKLQFVERARLQVSAARHPVEPLPACLYPGSP